MTGRHSGKFERHGLDGVSLAPGQQVTLAEVLQESGYNTALFGKSAPLTNPVLSGFDYFLGQVDQAFCHAMYPSALDSGSGAGSYPLPLNEKERSRAVCMGTPEAFNYIRRMFSWTGQ